MAVTYGMAGEISRLNACKWAVACRACAVIMVEVAATVVGRTLDKTQ
jgi:hypothetical protein